MSQSAKPPTVAGSWLKVPAGSVHPGQRITVTGYVPGAEPATAAARSQSFATLCFGGCSNGLQESALTVHWSTSIKDQFTMMLTIPATAWLTPSGTQPLENGTYRLSAQCLTNAPGCGLRPGAVSTVVHLSQVSYKPCPKTSCGFISLSATTAAPGTLVRFHGWAPLDQGIGTTSFPYDLVMVPGNLSSRFIVTIFSKGSGTQVPGTQVASVQQALNGTFSGSLRIPAALSGFSGSEAVSAGRYTLALQAFFINKSPFTDVTFAPTAVTVSANQTWASLGPLAPIASTWSANLYGPSLEALTQAPNRIVACVNRQIRLSTNGGQSWSSVPDSMVIQAAAKTTYPLAIFGNGTQGAPCNSVLTDAAHPQTIYATFAAEFAPDHSVPPVFTVGYLTTNLGRTWSAVPPPAGYTMGDFGGFQPDGAKTLALFARFSAQTGLPAGAVVLQTTDGGVTWTSGQTTCPALGPCLRFGAAPAQTGGMGVGYTQSVQWSQNGGSSWQSPSWPSQVTLNQGSSQLVALTSSRALLLSGASQYTLRLTTDGGRLWQNISLPPVPNAQNGAIGLNDALILPSGALLAQDPNQQSWILLPPGQSAWCTLTGLPSGLASQPIVVASRLWYATGSANSAPQTITSTPLSAIHCGG